jgi:hypothetical protein
VGRRRPQGRERAEAWDESQAGQGRTVISLEALRTEGHEGDEAVERAGVRQHHLDVTGLGGQAPQQDAGRTGDRDGPARHRTRKGDAALTAVTHKPIRGGVGRTGLIGVRRRAQPIDE